MANVYQTVFTWVAGDQMFQNVLHFKLTESGSGSPTDYAADLNTAIDTNILPVWQTMISSDCELRSLKTKRVTGGGGFNVLKLYEPGSLPGTGGTPIGNTCENAVLEFPVHLSGKNVTGKIFVSGVPDSAIVGNGFTSGFLSTASTFMTNLFDTLTLSAGHGDANFTIFNRTTGDDMEPVIGQVAAVVGTQHRRLRP